MDDTITAATYGKLFPDQLADKCSPEALESNTGPLAYLHALYQQALSLEAKGNSKHQIKLTSRRPDIGEKVLDETSLNAKVPALTLVIEALTRQARQHAGGSIDLAQAISEARYPSRLPFHYPLEQIKAVLRHKKCSLFDLLQQSEYSYPNFSYGNLRTEELRQVMRTATGFSPALQTLLLDTSAATDANFLKELYGVNGSSSSALEQLTRVEFLCGKTGLKPESILDLLATSGVADEGKEAFTTVKQSSAYVPTEKVDATAIAGHLYGAVFINNATAPALSLEDTYKGPGISLRIKGANADHFGRIQKIVHLQQALQLPFVEVDLLVMAALRAEGQTKDFHITENTLRALGVFCHLRNEYDVTAEQFAALIDGVTPYTVGEVSPFLDRILDGPGAGQLANIDNQMLLDGREFERNPNSNNPDSVKSAIGGICQAFALEERVANACLSQVTQALGLEKPALSLSVFSSLYRLARLPRLFRLGMNEGTSLIMLLTNTNPEVIQLLAGTPKISNDNEKPDILDVLIGLVNLEKWLRRQRVSAQALLSWLTPMRADIPAELKSLYRMDARITQALSDALPRIKASRLTEGRIAQEIGPYVLPVSDSWLSALGTYLDIHGLVKSIYLSPDESLATKIADELKNKLKSTNQLRLIQVNISEVADKLARLINNALIAQEDIAKHVISTAFGKDEDGLVFTDGHALPLLRWINKTRVDLLADVLAAVDIQPVDVDAALDGLNIELWNELARHAQAITNLRLSAEGLTALLNHPAWFDLQGEQADSSGTTSPPLLSLDLCYQVSRYRDWVEQCQLNGFEEADALGYFKKLPTDEQPDAVEAASKRLGKLIEWHESEVLLAMPHVEVVRKSSENEDTPKTFDDFLNSLTASELSYYSYCERSTERKGLGVLIFKYLRNQRANANDPKAEIIYDKFMKFVEDNPGPIKVTRYQYLPDTVSPAVWEDIINEKKAVGSRSITLEIYPPKAQVEETKYTGLPCVPTTISDIDFILRTQTLCETTGLSCQSLLDISWFDEQTSYSDFQMAGQLMIGACSDEALQQIEPDLQEHWRDALSAYLMGYWAPSNTSLETTITTVDDLSSYFLTDVLVSSAVKTTSVTQITANLQHYLHRLFARLEPGYETTIIEESDSNAWRQYLSEYGSWKRWQTQLNHPENLIYYANRPNKSTAFQELEVELNQGKLDTELLQTAITSYLTKFEQTSNLQVVSGYLDGVDPKNDTYHFIGKTNVAPAEYYWRSVDMGLRDDQERLSPLAWSEWEKIGLAVSGQITRSSYTDPNTKDVFKSDAIRPLIIEGRPYVFWVERGTTGLPNADDKNQTPTKFKKISVQYIYKQSDGFWSPANELLCLDGTKDGKRLPDKDNPYLKDDTYEPGLIALVNVEGGRAKDPWLTVMLYNCAYKKPTKTVTVEPEKYGNLNEDYFIEARDLLLVDKKQLSDTEKLNIFSKTIYNSYSATNNIQHPYSGEAACAKLIMIQNSVSTYLLEPYKRGALTTPNITPIFIDNTYFGTSTYSDDLAQRVFRTIESNQPLLAQAPFIIYNPKTMIENLLDVTAKKLKVDILLPGSNFTPSELRMV